MSKNKKPPKIVTTAQRKHVALRPSRSEIIQKLVRSLGSQIYGVRTYSVIKSIGGFYVCASLRRINIEQCFSIHDTCQNHLSYIRNSHAQGLPIEILLN